MEKVYLQGGPFDGEVREVEESVLFSQFSPGHVRYKDSGQINQDGRRIFVHEPRKPRKPGEPGDVVQRVTDTLTVTGDAGAASPGAGA